VRSWGSKVISSATTVDEARWLTARALTSWLYGVAPLDPVTFAAVPVVLGLATLAACVIPARRAASVDPMTALR
jgi:ABC-type antimicrobial peptide transport system permease subunit